MSQPFFHIEMLPAGHGDCIWVEYGQDAEIFRILIDGGTLETFEFIDKRIRQMPDGDRSFELIVLSHVDADHIEGLVRLLAESPLPIAVDKVWFNGWRQMRKLDGTLGPLQGEFLSALLAKRASHAWDPESPPWAVSSKGDLRSIMLPGGMQLTLLSPDAGKLEAMAKFWEPVIIKAGFQAGDLESALKTLAKRKEFHPGKGLLGTDDGLDTLITNQFAGDRKAPNGSSIAFLAEFKGKSALFLADAHTDIILRSIRRLCRQRRTHNLAVGAVKASHHGSKGNTSSELLGMIRSPVYLISTNGQKFKHPDKECIARILNDGKPDKLYFNYRSEYTEPWLQEATQKQHGFISCVRPESALSIKVEL